MATAATTTTTARVIRRLSDERASDLAKQAIDLSNAGDNEVGQYHLYEPGFLANSFVLESIKEAEGGRLVWP